MDWPFVILFIFLGVLATLIKIATLGYFQKDDNPYHKHPEGREKSEPKNPID